MTGTSLPDNGKRDRQDNQAPRGSEGRLARPLGLDNRAVPMRLARGDRDWRAVRRLVPALLILPFAEDVTFRPLGPHDVRLAPPILWLACPFEEPLSGPAVLLFVDADAQGLAVELIPAAPDHREETVHRPGTSSVPFRS
jgi:hypothetical protein